jgi:hypothetical protein
MIGQSAAAHSDRKRIRPSTDAYWRRASSRDNQGGLLPACDRAERYECEYQARLHSVLPSDLNEGMNEICGLAELRNSQ